MSKTVSAPTFNVPLPPARLRAPLSRDERVRGTGMALGAAPAVTPAETAAAEPETQTAATPPRSLLARIGVLLAAIAVPVMAAPGDFGALPADAAPEPFLGETVNAGGEPALPYDKAGMSFPGSAFYYLADPPMEALVALPSSDPLTEGRGIGGRDVGALIDAGAAASPFLTAGLGTNHDRAHQCLAQAVWYEAGSESEAGQRAVAQVVLNRVAHPSWPGSICGVVYQGSQRRTGCQFTFTCDGSLSRQARGRSWEAAKRVASAALSGDVYAPIGHATHYHTLWVNPYWAKSLDHIGTIGAHHFYRNRGRAGEKAAFTTRYAGAEPHVSGRRLSGDGGARTAAIGADAGFAAAPTMPAVPASAAVQMAPQETVRAPALADPELAEAGRARSKYANAGQWKRDPAELGLSGEVAPKPAASDSDSANLNDAPPEGGN